MPQKQWSQYAPYPSHKPLYKSAQMTKWTRVENISSMHLLPLWYWNTVNTMKPGQNDRPLADGMNLFCIWLKFSWDFLLTVQIHNKSFRFSEWAGAE